MVTLEVTDIGAISDAIDHLKAFSDILVNYEKTSLYRESVTSVGLMVLRETLIIEDWLDFVDCKEKASEAKPGKEE